jgi:GNAT superfamily N-acetyltransferase
MIAAHLRRHGGAKMSAIRFSVMADFTHGEAVAAMMKQLYEEDRSERDVDHSKFPANIEYLVAHPAAGQIVLFCESGEVRGYALLVPYWSNEFGGRLLFVDELFVVAEFRGRGIGRSFFRYLERERPFGPVALALGVNSGNERARRLYESLGFVDLRLATLTRGLVLEEAR